MNKQEARNLLMDYMYGELDPGQVRALEEFMQNDPELKEEFNELNETRSLLQHLPVQSPEEQLVMMAPEENRSQTASDAKSWWSIVSNALFPKQGFGRFAFGVATGSKS